MYDKSLQNPASHKTCHVLNKQRETVIWKTKTNVEN